MGTGSSGFRTPGRSRSMSIRCTNGWRWHGKWELGLKVRRGQWRMTEFGTVSCLFPPARVIATRRPLSLAIAVQREVEGAPSRLHAEPQQPQVHAPPNEGSRFSITGDNRCSEPHRQLFECVATGGPISAIAPSHVVTVKWPLSCGRLGLAGCGFRSIRSAFELCYGML